MYVCTSRRNARTQQYLLVESNFRVYAETSSELQIRLLSIFADMVPACRGQLQLISADRAIRQHVRRQHHAGQRATGAQQGHHL